MADDRIEIEITLDDGSVVRGLARTVAAAKKSGKTIGESITGPIRDQFRRLGPLVAGAFSVGAIVKSTQQLAALEKAIVGVSKTTNLGGKELDIFTDQIQILSKTVPVSTNDLLELAQAGGQLGVRGTANLLKFSETVARLNVATDLVGSDGAKSLVRILNVTQESVGTIDRFGSVIVALGNNLAATESEIVSITNEVARGAAQFGFSAAQSAALGGALKALGVQSESAGTQIQTVLLSISKAISDGGRNLERFATIAGTTSDKLSDDFGKDANKVFIDFISGLRRIKDEGGKIDVVLSSVGLTNQRLLKVIPPLVNGFDQYRTAIALTNTELKNATALNNESNKAFKTLGSQITLVQTAFTNLSTNLSESSSQGIKDFLSIIVTQVNEVNDALKGLGSIDLVIGAAFTNILLAITKFGIGLAETINNSKVLQALFPALAAASALSVDTMKEKAKELEDSLVNIAPEVNARLASVNLFEKIQKDLDKLGKGVKKITKQIVLDFKGPLVSGIAAGAGAFGKALAGGKAGFADFGKSVLGIIGDMAVQIGTTLIGVGFGIDALKLSLGKLSGGQAIAAGIALVAIGSLLKSLSGGAGPSTAPASAGGTDGGATLEPVIDDEPPELEPEKQGVAITIEGAIDPRGTAEQVVNLLNDFADTNGGVIFNQA